MAKHLSCQPRRRLSRFLNFGQSRFQFPKRSASRCRARAPRRPRSGGNMGCWRWLQATRTNVSDSRSGRRLRHSRAGAEGRRIGQPVRRARRPPVLPCREGTATLRYGYGHATPRHALPIVWRSDGREYNADLIVVPNDGTCRITDIKVDDAMSSEEFEAKRQAVQRWVNRGRGDRAVRANAAGSETTSSSLVALAENLRGLTRSQEDDKNTQMFYLHPRARHGSLLGDNRSPLSSCLRAAARRSLAMTAWPSPTSDGDS
jgi:hypothetical protein